MSFEDKTAPFLLPCKEEKKGNSSVLMVALYGELIMNIADLYVSAAFFRDCR